ncbi:MAG: hypothetical protein R8P61_07030 [Bacteroidia bacterium]|nr:hypothetical protein [Bacteroidia bacterium]
MNTLSHLMGLLLLVSILSCENTKPGPDHVGPMLGNTEFQFNVSQKADDTPIFQDTNDGSIFNR